MVVSEGSESVKEGKGAKALMRTDVDISCLTLLGIFYIIAAYITRTYPTRQ